ncbi:MAG: hypothetical protein CMP76_17250 [Flavobacterium sp.]|uniref:phage tail tube protein n=1 Tax=Flavobacterium sp. TaxID=239 RepID=UPI000C36FC37|nr:phage tail tube protein [Flavobacterium sp.]MBF05026.1 hypothetical protein [Flavobacterium sp.]|tara:strand:+ start:1029 stop:1451 length:423 start_codon:yes stop_codon:yes gene_type:complete
MAAGEIYKGSNVRFSFEGKTLFHATSCAISISTTLEEIATKDTNGSVVTPGNYSWSMTTNALVADKPAASTTQEGFMDIVALQLNKTLIAVEFTDSVTGSFILSGNVYVESVNISAEVGASVTGDFSFKGTGDLTKSVVS